MIWKNQPAQKNGPRTTLTFSGAVSMDADTVMRGIIRSKGSRGVLPSNGFIR